MNPERLISIDRVDYQYLAVVLITANLALVFRRWIAASFRCFDEELLIRIMQYLALCPP